MVWILKLKAKQMPGTDSLDADTQISSIMWFVLANEPDANAHVLAKSKEPSRLTIGPFTCKLMRCDKVLVKTHAKQPGQGTSFSARVGPVSSRAGRLSPGSLASSAASVSSVKMRILSMLTQAGTEDQTSPRDGLRDGRLVRPPKADMVHSITTANASFLGRCAAIHPWRQH